MATENQGITIFAGETQSITVTVTSATTGAVVDLTGATITWILKNTAGTTILTKTVGSGITVSAPTTGVFVVALSAANTTGLSGSYQHEARTTLADGTVSTVLTGTFTAKPSLI